jgi:amino acid adenylation domain-containing protein
VTETVRRDDVEDLYELSPLQQAILFHELRDPPSRLYFVQLVSDVLGDFDQTALRRAWEQVTQRHPVLRTSVHWEELDKPLQLVRRRVGLPLQIRDLCDTPSSSRHWTVREALAADRKRGFTLSDAPLFRLSIFLLEPTHWIFAFSYHHIILDGWSVGIILDEVTTLYKGERRGILPPSAPYSDYIGWLQEQDANANEQFWRGFLSGVTTPSMPPMLQTSTRSATADHRTLEVFIPPETTAELRAMASLERVTMGTIVYAAWAYLLYRYTGEPTVVFGTTVSGRNLPLRAIESMVGLFINTLPLVVHVPSEGLVCSWLRDVQARHAALCEHEHTSLTDIRRWSGFASGVPLFQSIVVFERFSIGSSGKTSKDDLHADDGARDQGTDLPLSLCLADTGQELVGSLTYDTGRLESAAMEHIPGHLITLLMSIARGASTRLRTLDILTDDERQILLVGINDTRRQYPSGCCIHHLFEEQAAKTPDAIALVDGPRRVTYKLLEQAAEHWAARLVDAGVGTETLVAVCCFRTAEMVAVLYGILKAGGAYVPVDPQYPEDRIAFMLQNASASHLVIDPCLLSRVDPHKLQIIPLERLNFGETLVERTSRPPVHPRNLAYVLYTSGSTGKPKGVAIEHASAVTLQRWAHETYRPADLSGVLATTSICFDCSIFELFAPLSWGGKVILAANAVQIPDTGPEDPITMVSMVPSNLLVQLRSRSLPPTLRAINLGGEASPRELVEILGRDCNDVRVFHVYGPTEGTTYSTCTPLHDFGNRRMPIGRPIANTRVYILDASRNLVPLGVVGEIFIAGDGLARGYLARPELTAEKFVPDNVSGRLGDRLYSTGDLGRYRNDWEIELVGRRDHQVKLRGLRVELGEIESVLQRHPSVGDVAAVLEGSADQARLIAYLTSRSECSIDFGDLRRFAHAELPQAMVPSEFFLLDSMPRNTNGKINRQALTRPTRTQSSRKVVSPRDRWEFALVQICEDLLGVRPISLGDTFAGLGVHSLQLISILSRIQRTFGVRLALASLFEQPTIGALAATIRRSNPEVSASPLVTFPGAGDGGSMFWIHPALGVLCYGDLARYLGVNLRTYAFQAQGLEKDEPPLSRIEDMAERYLTQLERVEPRGPVVLGGWSLGGLVAYEMANRLAATGRSVRFVALLDCWAPSERRSTSKTGDDEGEWLIELLTQFGLPHDDAAEALSGLPAQEASRKALSIAQGFEPMLADMSVEEADRLLRVFTSHCRAQSLYLPRPFPGRVAVFAAAERLDDQPHQPDLGWARLALAVDCHEVPGNHWSMMREPHVVVLATRLRGLIQAGLEIGQ